MLGEHSRTAAPSLWVLMKINYRFQTRYERCQKWAVNWRQGIKSLAVRVTVMKDNDDIVLFITKESNSKGPSLGLLSLWPLLSVVPWKCPAMPVSECLCLQFPFCKTHVFQQTNIAGSFSPLGSRVKWHLPSYLPWPQMLKQKSTITCPCHYLLIFFMALITMWNHIDYLLTYLMLVSFILLTTSSSVRKQGGLYGYSTDTSWMNKWTGGANVTLKYHCLLVTQCGKYAGSRKWQGFFSQEENVIHYPWGQG